MNFYPSPPPIAIVIIIIISLIYPQAGAVALFSVQEEKSKEAVEEALYATMRATDSDSDVILMITSNGDVAAGAGPEPPLLGNPGTSRLSDAPSLSPVRAEPEDPSASPSLHRSVVHDR